MRAHRLLASRLSPLASRLLASRLLASRLSPALTLPLSLALSHSHSLTYSLTCSLTHLPSLSLSLPPSACRYVLIAETDHVLMKPLPNLATPTEGAAHAFGYMHAGSHHQKVVELCDPHGSWRNLQPIGPSPLIIRCVSYSC